jgi:superfamily II DNA/RNA helicase
MEESTPDFAAHVLSTPTTSADATTAPRPFRTPDTLKECVVTCTTETKPLLLAMLLRAIHQQNNQCNVLIFTGTVKNTHRLCRLLQILDVMEHHPAVRTAATLGGSSSDSSSDSGSDSGGSDAEEHVGREEEDVHSHARSLLPYLSQTSVLEYSSMVPAKQRASHLKRFAAAPSTNNNKQHHQRQCRVLVCSDAGARGLDIEQVTDVINYDVPNEAKTYVHRVGRTARAGRNGTAYTMLKPGQMGSYHSMMKSITHNAIQVYPTQSERVEVLKELYVKSLTVLKQVMELEEDEGQ